jgi:hypothetical protein
LSLSAVYRPNYPRMTSTRRSSVERSKRAGDSSRRLLPIARLQRGAGGRDSLGLAPVLSEGGRFGLALFVGGDSIAVAELVAVVAAGRHGHFCRPSVPFRTVVRSTAARLWWNPDPAAGDMQYGHLVAGGG